jgi:hypothetical protein
VGFRLDRDRKRNRNWAVIPLSGGSQEDGGDWSSIHPCNPASIPTRTTTTSTSTHCTSNDGAHAHSAASLPSTQPRSTTRSRPRRDQVQNMRGAPARLEVEELRSVSKEQDGELPSLEEIFPGPAERPRRPGRRLPPIRTHIHRPISIANSTPTTSTTSTTTDVESEPTTIIHLSPSVSQGSDSRSAQQHVPLAGGPKPLRRTTTTTTFAALSQSLSQSRWATRPRQ